eukprot:TRINITY_DN57162_c0_g1_i1.p1 TRINITY_DN57162_c0_g1~~TRINITY_DN57162_c0_g1_i1.p1  ORF type:complete len:338 (+),score=22.01 TRINITY_DN57162_c0_g1_i1:51-1064(+)
MSRHRVEDVDRELNVVRRWREGERPSLAYRLLPSRLGIEQGTVVVLLHGLGDNGLCFRRLLHRLPAEWTYVALDWRGHGYSDWLPHGISGYSQADHVVDLVLFLQSLRRSMRPARLFVVGHSLGGLVAISANAIGGAVFDGLVMLEQNGAAGMHPEHFCRSQGMRLSHAITSGLLALERRHFSCRAEALQWTTERHLGTVSPGARASADVSTFVLDAISELKPDGGIVILADPRLHAAKDAFFFLPRDFERDHVLPRVTCPVCFILSDDGPCQTQICKERGMPSLGDRWADLTAPKRLFVTPSGGHYPHVEQSTIHLVAEFIEEFIRTSTANLGSNL